jgi:hypothetical protein
MTVLREDRVDVVAVGWQQDDGFLAYQVDGATFVDIDMYPLSQTKSAGILALARAMKAAYSR